MVKGGLLLSGTLKRFSLQELAVCEGICGIGLRVTTKVNGVPVQLPAAPETGVMV
jgi:hypothetical protein